MGDKLLANKWVVYDRLSLMRDLAQRQINEAFEEYDARLFTVLFESINTEMSKLVSEIQKREGR